MCLAPPGRLASEPAFLKLLKSDLVKKGDEGATGGAAGEGDERARNAQWRRAKNPSLIGRPSFSLSLRPSVCASVQRGC